MNAIGRILVDPDDWQLAAACRGSYHLFFPPDQLESKIERRRRETQAKGLCAGCQVRKECLDEALGDREKFGIWGGTTERERRLVFARRRTESPQDVAGPGRPARLPAVVVRDRAASTPE